jgi:lysozyme family protein
LIPYACNARKHRPSQIAEIAASIREWGWTMPALIDEQDLIIDGYRRIADAQAIYERDYWAKAGCPDLPSRLAFAVFDAAVNNGVGRGVRWLQAAVGAEQDGAYGSGTKAAVARAVANDPLDMKVAQEVHARRIHFMAQLDAWKTFRLGRGRRLAAIPAQGAHDWRTDSSTT